MKLERSSWAGRTMLVVFFFALILSCGAGDVHAAVNSSAKTSASTGKGSTSKVKKGLIWEKGGYRYYVNNKPVRNTWKIIRGKYYWFRENGVAARGGACNVRGIYYVFDMNSHKVTPGSTKVVKINTYWFIVNKYGKGVGGWQEDTLNLYFSYPGYLEIPVGTWCDFYGKRYSLKKDSNFKKKGERNFEYTLILETAKADAMMWKVRHIADNSIKFAYTAKAHEHLRLLVENLNRRDMGWKVGDCIEGTEKVINYNHTYILDALNQLADTYETEWQITGKTVHLRKVEYNKNNPLKLSYGKGHGFKVGVGRESGDIPPEIVLVETSDRNINYSTYGAKYLLLPKSKTLHYEGRTYITFETEKIALVSNPIHTGSKEPVVWYQLGELMKNAKNRVKIHTPYIICNDMMYNTWEEIAENVSDFSIMTNSVANNGNPFGAKLNLPTL